MTTRGKSVIIDRESVGCTVCGATPGDPCDFNGSPAPMVNDDGVQRRSVHAARYAESLPPEARNAFWETAVESYLTKELALIAERSAAPSGTEQGQ